MARSFIQSVLAAAVAAVVGGNAVAQEPLKEAVSLIRFGKDEEAKTKLREILSADPSNAEALQLYQSVSQDEYLMMLTGSDDEIRKIAATILERAKAERRERSRDEGTIRELVGAATAAGSDFKTRQDAINKLVMQHGEFAVPMLVEKLGDSDDNEGQVQAIYTLSRLGAVAVLPLIESLKSSKSLVVQNAAAALHHIGDARAIPAMVHLVGDSRNNVSTIAKTFLQKRGVRGSAVELLLGQARSYLTGHVPAGGFSDVVWRLVDDQLVATDVHPLLYPTELAKACAADAFALAPQSQDAASALAQANLAQANLIQSAGDEALQGMQAAAGDLRIAALASGLPAVRAALDAGIAQGLAPVALGAIDALAAAETADTIGQSSLVRALEASDKRVQYAAATALVRATGGVNLPNSDKVVGVLADAVAEEQVRTIRVIDPTQESKVAAMAASSLRGNAVVRDANAVTGLGNLLKDPSVDVVVINELLPDALPEVVIGNLKKDPRFAETRIVIIAKDVEAAQAHFGETVNGVVQAPLSGEALIAEVNRVLDGVNSPGGARAEAYAKGASEALLAVAAKKGRIDGALDSLTRQLNRGDAVAVPAARALGLGGNAGQLEALVAALGAGTPDVKKAAAEAIGNILARMNDCPLAVADALIELVASDAEQDLRTAVAVALGKAKLEPAKAAQLQAKLRKAGMAPKAEG